MALERQIDSAANTPKPPVGNFMGRDAWLVMPRGERGAAEVETARAARFVHRHAADHEHAWVCRNKTHPHYGPLAQPVCPDTECARTGYPAGTPDTDQLLATLGLAPDTEPATRICSRCQLPKPLTDFPRNTRSRGAHAYCRTCNADYKRTQNGTR